MRLCIGEVEHVYQFQAKTISCFQNYFYLTTLLIAFAYNVILFV